MSKEEVAAALLTLSKKVEELNVAVLDLARQVLDQD